ncbi:hypothetical protein KPL76_00080 [Subtercola sp. PAMC28395]|uniref:hypothetical protein n=1 Tax=Subtercola sp. PAMC28395 TaxID=2846775 RepID=UPI001C0D983C|nr:hypothetical protein [Subtercola sp. PAMC28395]QWT23895.1 hypothetical protein KPL76_00080 [Subtercola sp. PAMC28395]
MFSLSAGFLVVATVSFGTPDTFVWLPEATASTVPLEGIYEALRLTDLFAIAATAIIWMLFWGVFGVGFAGTWGVWLHSIVSLRLFVAIVAAIISMTVLFHLGPNLAMGSAVSDTLPPGAGVDSVEGVVFGYFGLAMFSVAVGFFVSWLLSRSRPRPDARLQN